MISAPTPSPLVEDNTIVTAQATVTVSDPDSDVRYVLSGGWTAVNPGGGAQAYNGHYYVFVALRQQKRPGRRRTTRRAR